MRRIPENLIDKIRSNSDIVETVSQYLPLTKRGKNFWGLCPFHDDSNPSMSVSSERQIFKCFVCGAGGNVFTFIEKFENISFVEAVIKQGHNINMDLQEYATVTARPVNKRRARLIQLMKEVENFATYQLSSQDGIQALQILKERGYSESIIKKYKIGLALRKHKIYNFLKAKGFEDEEMLSVDMIRLGENDIQDVFYDRLMFPIHDQFDNIIAFSARTIDPNNSVKYINTGETELYTKGDHIYNLNRIKLNKKTVDTLIITEGVTDVFAFDMAGIENVVSLLGVSCTDQQLKLIQSTSRNVILAFDGDQAGYEATYNIGKKLINHNISVSVWYNDSERDPDDLYREFGAKPLLDGIDDALSWYDFILVYAQGQYGMNSFENRKRVVNFVLPYLSQADSLTQDYYLNKLSDKTGFTVDTLKSQISGIEIKQKSPVVITNRSKYHVTQNVSRAELEILKQMLLSKEASIIYRDKLGFLPNDLAFEFSLLLIDVYRTKDVIEIADLLSIDLSENMQQFVLELEERLTFDVYNQEVVLENIGFIKKRLERQNEAASKQEILRTEQIDAQLDLLKDIISKKRKG
ncbi:MAG TPA: DNA primase [Erysipelothrix sp.]|nr:DNA primase [Erysipelothrix sp.]